MADTISDAEFQKVLDGLNVLRPDPDNRYRVVLRLDESVLVMTITGSVIQPVASEFQQRMDDLFKHERARRAIIDLSKCEYLSSSAFGVLMEFFHVSNQQGGQLLLVLPSLRLRKLIEILGMDQFFLVVDDLATAKAYYHAHSAMKPPASAS